MDENKGLKAIPTPTQRLQNLVDKLLFKFDVDRNQPAKMYVRSGHEMIRMADQYQKQGFIQEPYLLYMKFMTLFIEKMKDHPGWSSVPAAERKQIRIKINSEVMPKTEKLKDQLMELFNKEYIQQINEEEKEQKRLKTEQDEKKRRQEEQLKRQKQHEDSGRNKHAVSDHRTHVVTDPTFAIDSIVYPEADKRPSTIELRKEPSAPWMEDEDHLYPYTNDYGQPGTDFSEPESHGKRLPAVDRSTKPPSLLSPSTQSRVGLRNVVVPNLLVERFLLLAQSTTMRNIETCGILAGRLDQNQLVITHLLVPKQHASPDSCTTENEEEVFNYQDRHDLITLGWIHTHPSQTAFLSSVDLHTHCSYQLMLPEAVAIVCAPRYKDNSIFSLTPHYGLSFIAKCTKSGFHPHPSEPPLFMVAEHARLESQLPVEVVDLRT